MILHTIFPVTIKTNHDRLLECTLEILLLTYLTHGNNTMHIIIADRDHNDQLTDSARFNNPPNTL